MFSASVLLPTLSLLLSGASALPSGLFARNSSDALEQRGPCRGSDATRFTVLTSIDKDSAYSVSYMVSLFGTKNPLIREQGSCYLGTWGEQCKWGHDEQSRMGDSNILIKHPRFSAGEDHHDAQVTVGGCHCDAQTWKCKSSNYPDNGRLNTIIICEDDSGPLLPVSGINSISINTHMPPTTTIGGEMPAQPTQVIRPSDEDARLMDQYVTEDSANAQKLHAEVGEDVGLLQAKFKGDDISIEQKKKCNVPGTNFHISSLVAYCGAIDIGDKDYSGLLNKFLENYQAHPADGNDVKGTLATSSAGTVSLRMRYLSGHTGKDFNPDKINRIAIATQDCRAKSGNPTMYDVALQDSGNNFLAQLYWASNYFG
ncbi:hypothetical protein B0H13DRAFT_982110 [Mycena leptocephala]|nr:hypothetical protein B0H13DRAFT_982110 [Mycena leptocephala]